MSCGPNGDGRAIAAPRAPAPAYAIGAVFAAACIFAPLSRAAAAEVSAAPPPAAVAKIGTCRHAADIKATLFPRSAIAAYDFTGAEAKRLTAAMPGADADAQPPATLVRLVLVPATRDAYAFRFGPDGCNDATLALDYRGMERVFRAAGIPPPFGATFYRLPKVSF
jgi:hypothetical protein